MHEKTGGTGEEKRDGMAEEKTGTDPPAEINEEKSRRRIRRRDH